MAYLRCDSEPQIVDGQVTCSAWQFVSEAELSGLLSQGYVMSSQDFHIVAGGVTTILLAAIGVRFLLKVFFPKGY